MLNPYVSPVTGGQEGKSLLFLGPFAAGLYVPLSQSEFVPDGGGRGAFFRAFSAAIGFGMSIALFPGGDPSSMECSGSSLTGKELS